MEPSNGTKQSRTPCRKAVLASPLGLLSLYASEEGLVRIDFPGDSPWEPVPLQGGKAASDVIDQAVDELAQYFHGSRRDFAVKLRPEGTPFQQAVWQELLQIPYGKTSTYGEIAKALGKPLSVRAVGAANGKNPLPIIVPCHRVIGADGSLTGYAGGLPIKRWLLEHEGAQEALGQVELPL